MPARKKWIQRRQRSLSRWLEEARPVAALSDWTITVDWEGDEHTHPTKGEPGALATITHMPDSKHAVLRVSDELLWIDPQEQLQVLTHELMHCHLFSLHDYAKAAFAAASKRNSLAQELHEHTLTAHVETAVDGLADALSSLMPPIDLS